MTTPSTPARGLGYQEGLTMYHTTIWLINILDFYANPNVVIHPHVNWFGDDVAGYELMAAGAITWKVLSEMADITGFNQHIASLTPKNRNRYAWFSEHWQNLLKCDLPGNYLLINCQPLLFDFRVGDPNDLSLVLRHEWAGTLLWYPLVLNEKLDEGSFKVQSLADPTWSCHIELVVSQKKQWAA